MYTQNCYLEVAEAILCVPGLSTSVGRPWSGWLVFKLAAIEKLVQSRATLRSATEDRDWHLSKQTREYQ
jgi:hypothetical protein